MANENHFDSTLPYPLVILGLILMPLGMVEQVLVISYEMFGMDPMKRGIVNRVRLKSLLEKKNHKMSHFFTVDFLLHGLGFFPFILDRTSLDLPPVLDSIDGLRLFPDC